MINLVSFKNDQPSEQKRMVTIPMSAKARRHQCSINRKIYHLLSRAFGQCVAIAQIVDFNVFDVIAVIHVYVTIQLGRTLAGGRRRGLRGGNGTGRLDGQLEGQIEHVDSQAHSPSESEAHRRVECLSSLAAPH